MKIIIARHTNTAWNTEGRIQGQKDIPLSEEGRKGAQELGEKLIDLGIIGIVSSDLIRALETSQIINETLQVPLETTKDLRECFFGSIEGMTHEEVIKNFGTIIPDLNEKTFSYDFHSFGGENKSEVLLRHMNVLHDLSKNNLNESAILLVGHSLGMGTLLSKLGSLPTIEQNGYKILEYWPS